MMSIEISAGELLDRITILEIKLRRCGGAARRRELRATLDGARAAWQALSPIPIGIAGLRRRLSRVNQALWDAEDEIRRREGAQDFGPAFVAVARAICRLNDRRAALRRRVDELTGSPSALGDKIYAVTSSSARGARG
jgi:hypothetical protein